MTVRTLNKTEYKQEQVTDRQGNSQGTELVPYNKEIEVKVPEDKNKNALKPSEDNKL